MHTQLLSHTFDNLKLLAFRHPLIGAPNVGFHGGPVLLGSEWGGLRHSRYFQPVDWFDGHETVTKLLDGDYVYAGPAYDHFGHVMSEMVHRLLPSIAAFPNRKILLASALDDTRLKSMRDLPAFFQEVFGFFGITPDQVIVVNKDCVVKGLHVAQQGSDFGGGPRTGYLDQLAGFTQKFLAGYTKGVHDKVYVSRSGLPGSGLLGERYLEELLESQGFYIARPEAMTLLEQMSLYQNAKIVVFPEGSACHGVELLGSGSLNSIIFLARRVSHIEIFSKILASRSADYAVVAPMPGTTSLFYSLKHITVGYVDMHTLFILLKQRGFCGTVTFDQRRYREASLADFASHVAHYQAIDRKALDPFLIIQADAYFSRNIAGYDEEV